jgi:hypothetical protein
LRHYYLAGNSSRALFGRKLKSRIWNYGAKQEFWQEPADWIQNQSLSFMELSIGSESMNDE